MKSFWVGVFSSLLVSFLMLGLGVYLTKPFFIYQIDETGTDIRFVVQNVGLSAADRIRATFVLSNEIEKVPRIRRHYWTKRVDYDEYFILESLTESFRLQFKDDGELGGVVRGNEMEIILVPKEPTNPNMVKAYELSMTKSIDGYLHRVDDIRTVRQAIPFGFLIIILFALTHLTLGYQYAKSRYTTNN